MINSNRPQAMIQYLITYLFSILFCGGLLTDDFLTHSHVYLPLVTTNQQHSKKLIPRIESELKMVHSVTKFDAYKPFVESIGDHWIDHYVDHCNTPYDKTAHSASLECKQEDFELPAALPCQPPRLPPRFLAGHIGMANTGATTTLAWETESARLLTEYTLAESHSPNSLVHRKKTGCSPGSAASLMLKNPK